MNYLIFASILDEIPLPFVIGLASFSFHGITMMSDLELPSHPIYVNDATCEINLSDIKNIRMSLLICFYDLFHTGSVRVI